MATKTIFFHNAIKKRNNSNAIWSNLGNQGVQSKEMMIRFIKFCKNLRGTQEQLQVEESYFKDLITLDSLTTKADNLSIDIEEEEISLSLFKVEDS